MMPPFTLFWVGFKTQEGSSYNNIDKARSTTYSETPQAAKSKTDNSARKIRSVDKRPKKSKY